MKDFSHLKGRKFSGFIMGIFAILISLVVGGTIAFFLFFFEISSVVIDRDKSDSNLRYEEMIHMMESTKKKNLLVISTDFLEKQFLIRFPELSFISIQKKYPNTLLVEAKTSPVVIEFHYSVEGIEEDIVGFVSKNGSFFFNGEENLFVIKELTPRKTYLSMLDQVFLENEVPEILDAKKDLEKVIGKKILLAQLLTDAQEIHFVDENGVKYWFFLKKDFSLQIEKLRRTIAERDIYKTPLEYIDLRIGRKVIYKPQQ